jgi:hypothetical protein
LEEEDLVGHVVYVLVMALHFTQRTDPEEEQVVSFIFRIGTSVVMVAQLL